MQPYIELAQKVVIVPPDLTVKNMIRLRFKKKGVWTVLCG